MVDLHVIRGLYLAGWDMYTRDERSEALAKMQEWRKDGVSSFADTQAKPETKVVEPELTAREKLYQSFNALDLAQVDYNSKAGGKGLDGFLLDLAERNIGKRARVADLVNIGLTQGFARTYIYARLHVMSNLTNKMRVKLADRSFWNQGTLPGGSGMKDWGFYTATKLNK